VTELTEQDLEALDGEIERWVRGRVAPEFAHSERILDPDRLRVLLEDAAAQGLVDSDQDAQMGLWLAPEHSSQRRFSVRTLQQVSRANAALAYALHLAGLSGWLQRQLGLALPQAGTAGLVIQGHYGLARHALARYLLGTDSADDQRLLRDHFNYRLTQPGLCLTIAAEAPWWVPELDRSGIIQFALYRSDAREIERDGFAHGLNELDSLRWWPRATVRPRARSHLDRAHSRVLWQQLLSLHWMGLLAISVGVVQRAAALADDYARQRCQGGSRIVAHPAVQQLLVCARSAHENTARALDGLNRRTFDMELLRALAQLRSVSQSALSEGANSALQVFGGMGYMQDTGVEKCVRDCMQLRLLAGTRCELELFVSALENAS
jgi:alkylation response protein AidB-like acyl-CoA dehydrogenase